MVPIHLHSDLFIDIEDLVYELNMASFDAFNAPANYLVQTFSPPAI